nr:replication protein A 70 kDa DNA-binding subunit B [Tanacetum cinerariifolium]
MGHVVMILQLAKFKWLNEKPSVSNAIYSTKLINDDILEIPAFKQRYVERDGFDPKNYTISLFSPVKKEITAEDFFKGGIKKMVGSICDSDSSFHYILYAKIHKIHHEHGWTYQAWKRCGRSANEVDDGQSSSNDKQRKKQQL